MGPEQQILVKLQTNYLGKIYMREFSKKETDPDAPSQLEMIAGIMSQRDFKERLSVYREIKLRYDRAISSDSKNLTKCMKRMMDHYHAHVLD